MMHKSYRILGIGVIFILCAIGIFVSGCASTSNHINAFSIATADISDQVVSSYELTSKTTIESNVVDIATRAGDDIANIDQDEISKIKPLFLDKLNKTSPSIKAVKALKEYAKALGDLSSADYDNEIDEATKDIYGSMDRLSNTYKELTDRDLGITDQTFSIVATAINAIGKQIIEHKRREAIKTIVIEVHPSLQSACEEIAKNIGGDIDLIKYNMNKILGEKIEDYKKLAVMEGVTLDKKVNVIYDLYEYNKLYSQTNKVFEKFTPPVPSIKRELRGVLV